jgi:putative salt-induced outer membrane protein YdiY
VDPALPPHTPPSPITCTLTNGDQLTGTVRNVSASRVRMVHATLGVITLTRDQIASCTSPDAVVRHRLGGLALAPFEHPPVATVTVADARGPQPLPRTAVRAVSLERLRDHPVAMPLAARALPTYVAHVGWKRNVGASYTLSRGNANVSDLGFSGGVTRRAQRSQIALRAKRRFGSKDGQQTADFFSSTLRYDLALGPNDSAASTRPSYFAESVYEHDPLAKIARRAVENTGFSIPLSPDPRNNLAVEIGLGVTHEEPANARSYTHAGGLLRLAARQAFGGTKSDQQLAAFPDLSGPPGHYRLNTDFNIAAPLAQSVSLKLGLTNRFDTRPQASARRADTTIQSGIGLEF